MTSLMLVAGTRPEAIKMAPVIEQLQKLRLNYTFVWSGQHYDYEMSSMFFEQLGLPEPDVNLNVRSGTHSQQTGEAMTKLEKTIRQSKPAIVVSEGDTNTVLAAALTSTKCLVPFAHVEAGLRSWNMAMPEEVNRKIADSIASVHFAPTKLAKLNLLLEGVPNKGLHLTGNTIVDIVHRHFDTANKTGEKLLTELNLEKKRFLLVTLHRMENTDNPSRLTNILVALKELANEYAIAFTVHPRTKKRIARLGLGNLLRKIMQLKPLGYFEFLGLLNNSLTILTDSGGVQEEACILKVPTVTLRYNTERPETLLRGNVLAAPETRTIVDLTHKQVELAEQIQRTRFRNPFGDGRAGERIAKILKDCLEEGLKISESDMRKSPFKVYRTIAAKQTYQNNMLMQISRSISKDSVLTTRHQFRT